MAGINPNKLPMAPIKPLNNKQGEKVDPEKSEETKTPAVKPEDVKGDIIGASALDAMATYNKSLVNGNIKFATGIVEDKGRPVVTAEVEDSHSGGWGNGSCQGNPGAWSIDKTKNQDGSYTVTITISDGRGGRVTKKYENLTELEASRVIAEFSDKQCRKGNGPA